MPKKAQAKADARDAGGADQGTGTWFEGVIPNLNRRFENTESEFVKARLHQYMSEQLLARRVWNARLRKGGRLAVRLHAEAGAGCPAGTG